MEAKLYGWMGLRFQARENDTERDEGEGVLAPMVLGIGMYAAQLICPLELFS